mgnify:FL=1|jgi:hypothetical protein
MHDPTTTKPQGLNLEAFREAISLRPAYYNDDTISGTASNKSATKP